VASLRSQIVKAEAIADRKIQVFGDMDGEVPMNDNDHMSFRAQVYPGHVEDEPIILVCDQKKAEEKQKDAHVVPDPSFNKKLKGSITWSEQSYSIPLSQRNSYTSFRSRSDCSIRLAPVRGG
jgi:hypothetical protein